MMGIGMIWLKTGAAFDAWKFINQAAKEMGMSYVKALKMLKNTEATLDDRSIKKSAARSRRRGTGRRLVKRL